MAVALSSRYSYLIDVQHLVSVVVDHFDGDSAGLGRVEGAAGGVKLRATVHSDHNHLPVSATGLQGGLAQFLGHRGGRSLVVVFIVGVVTSCDFFLTAYSNLRR